VIAGLEALQKNEIPVKIYSDSKYVVDAVEKGWLRTWLQNGFKGGKKNPDLWRQYHQLSLKFKISFHWVKGHADNPFNERCDVLATTAADSPHLAIDHGYENAVS
jgi:ribonuclease HI